jgi:hypothetical protein
MSDSEDNTASGMQATLAATTLPGFGPGTRILTDAEGKAAYDAAVQEVGLKAARERAVNYDPYMV